MSYYSYQAVQSLWQAEALAGGSNTGGTSRLSHQPGRLFSIISLLFTYPLPSIAELSATIATCLTSATYYLLQYTLIIIFIALITLACILVISVFFYASFCGLRRIVRGQWNDPRRNQLVKKIHEFNARLERDLLAIVIDNGEDNANDDDLGTSKNAIVELEAEYAVEKINRAACQVVIDFRSNINSGGASRAKIGPTHRYRNSPAAERVSENLTKARSGRWPFGNLL